MSHSAQSPTCSSCDSYQGCAEQAFAGLTMLSQEIDVSDYLYLMRRDNKNLKGSVLRKTNLVSIDRHSSVDRRYDISPSQQAVIDKVSGRYKKAERLMRSIFKNGIELHETLLEGQNPFYLISSHTYMRFVCDRLLAGGFTRREIKDGMMERMDWTVKTANSHVSVCVHTLVAMDIAEEIDGRFILRQK